MAQRDMTIPATGWQNFWDHTYLYFISTVFICGGLLAIFSVIAFIFALFCVRIDISM